MGNSLPVALSKCLKALNDGELGVKQCLSEYSEYSNSLSPLLGIATQLTYLPYVSPDSRYQEESRVRVLRYAEIKKKRSPQRKAERNSSILLLTRGLAFAALLVMGVGTFLGGQQVVYAADSSLPGDSLYNIKTSLEDAQVYVADDTEDVYLHVDFAEIRLSEMQKLTEIKRYEGLAIAAEGFERHTQLAYASLETVQRQDPAKGSEIAAFLEEKSIENVNTLNTLVASVPVEAQSSIQEALAVTVQLSGKTDTANESQPLDDVPPASAINSDDNADTGNSSDEPGNSGDTGKPETAGNSGANGNSGNANSNNGNGSSDEPGNSGDNGNGDDNGNGNGNGNGGGNDNGNGNGDEVGDNGNGNGDGDGGGGDNGNGNDNGNGGGNDNGNGNGNGDEGGGDNGNGNGDGDGGGGDNGNGNGNGNGGGNKP